MIHRTPSNFGELFEAPTAAQARDAAVAQVQENADAGWLAKAYAAGVTVCQSKAEFIVDDIQAVLTFAQVPPPREGRAMGAVVLRLVRDGLCVGTDRYRASDQAQCHRNVRRVWRSLIGKQVPNEPNREETPKNPEK